MCQIFVELNPDVACMYVCVLHRYSQNVNVMYFDSALDDKRNANVLKQIQSSNFSELFNLIRLKSEI